LRAGLNLFLVILRFLFAGLALNFLYRQTLTLRLGWEIAVLLVAALLLFWFEWAVERGVARSPDAWALRLAPVGRLVIALAAVLLFLPLTLVNESRQPVEALGTVTEDELKTLVDAGQEEGVFEQGERQMIYSVFELGDTLAREIMVPRIDMLALEVTTPLPEAIDALLSSGHSRVPVYEETIDNMLGLLYAKDLLRVWQEGNQIASLRSVLRPAYFVPEAKKVDDLLAEMQAQRVHIAIVVDEYGGVAGLVTLEDIVEEVVGEIRDEYDQGEELPYQKLKNGDYLFLGRVDLDDFNDIMGSQLPKDEADTLGGFIYSRVGRVPVVGENVQNGDLLLTVEQVSARRIRKVRARWELASPSDGEVESPNGR
jgi:CBS domain containing-hemolysin-like protein